MCSSDLTVYLNNSNLYSLNNGRPKLIDKIVTSFVLDGNNVWYLQKNLLKQTDLNSNQVNVINSNVPSASTAWLIRKNNQLYAVLDGNLYVLNDNFEKIYNNVNFAYFDDSSKLLVFANNNEILTFDPATTKTDLVLRSSSAVKNPVLNFATGFIFYQSQGKIQAVELDSRDQRNNFTVINDPTVSNFALSNDGRVLYTISSQDIKKYSIR